MAVGGYRGCGQERCKKRKPGGYVFVSTHCGTRVADAKSCRRNFLRQLSLCREGNSMSKTEVKQM